MEPAKSGKRKTGKTGVGFRSTEVSTPRFESSRRDVQDERGLEDIQIQALFTPWAPSPQVTSSAPLQKKIGTGTNQNRVGTITGMNGFWQEQARNRNRQTWNWLPQESLETEPNWEIPDAACKPLMKSISKTTSVSPSSRRTATAVDS